ncbi:type II toxin-antitoxin system RelE/ParE family toxin [Jiulongibacter sediminis]|uniref:Plasmid stabilization protein n=1 Tax=Jiulongibacter sediminis TaxID=1605367 RepID=A0A0P7BUD8_9BACT|nr:type II toxin-antitoxin system RelE/ParE family toxin [Jiulongibacter sediminis]KPM48365.1 hypothetical protein AFM12_06885 [Jiulongibacter sediminis]TBX24902.1 hypothetical protein TK44_06890 [Jiulongibacter sediminis]
MSYTVFYHEDVQNDIQDAVDWYDSIDKKLTDSLLEEIYNAIKRISENPQFYETKYRNVIRVRLLERFDYGLHFVLRENAKEVFVLAFLHGKQSRKRVVKRFI